MTTVHLAGKPVPQGGLLPLRTANGGARMRNKPGLVEYRDRLATELGRHRSMGQPALSTAVTVLVAVELERPASHYWPVNTKRRTKQLRADAPSWPTGRNSGDVDKLARTVLDALVIGGVLVDDSQVISLTVRKSWADQAGITVTLLEADSQVRPHTRACGWQKHDHGPACHASCPTCGGGR